MDVGINQIYYGDGKGKTTCAMGLILRALGQGLRVCVYQFLKCGDTGEFLFLKEHIPYCYSGLKGFLFALDEPEKALAMEREQELFAQAKEAIFSKKYDVVLLDELLNAIDTGAIPEGEVVSLMELKPNGVELILTGRNLPPAVVSCAHLITHMKKEKHNYDAGIPARRGIEF